MARGIIFLSSEVLCSFEFPLDPQRTYGSIAVLCPTCGEVWARFVVPGQKFYPAYGACERHPLGIPWAAGSLNLMCISDFRDYLPAEFWNRELRLLVNFPEL